MKQKRRKPSGIGESRKRDVEKVGLRETLKPYRPRGDRICLVVGSRSGLMLERMFLSIPTAFPRPSTMHGTRENLIKIYKINNCNLKNRGTRDNKNQEPGRCLIRNMLASQGRGPELNP